MPELDMSRDGNMGKMAPFKVYMKQLSLRNRAIIKREPQAFRAKFGNAIFSALLIIMLYW